MTWNRLAVASFLRVSPSHMEPWMPADWLTDEQEREPIRAHVFNLLRQIGREPARKILSSPTSAKFGMTLRAFLRSQGADRRPNPGGGTIISMRDTRSK